MAEKRTSEELNKLDKSELVTIILSMQEQVDRLSSKAIISFKQSNSATIRCWSAIGGKAIDMLFNIFQRIWLKNKEDSKSQCLFLRKKANATKT